MAAAAAAGAPPAAADPVDAEEEELREAILGMDMESLNISAENIDFSEVDDDLLKFQKDDIVREALSKGVDLRQYSRHIDEQLSEAEAACVEDCLRDSGSLAALHKQIKSCDAILERMQHMLNKFQGDLGNISSEIKHLQDKSMLMSVQLRNRKETEERLGTMIESISITQPLSTQICEAAVNEAYIEYLLVLNNKILALRNPNIRRSRAAQDVVPMVEKLRLKAISRVRQFLLERINQFKAPKTTIDVKQNLLLKFCYLYEFLIEQRTPDSDIASEVRQTYIDTMGKSYLSHFKTYLGNLKKLQSDNKAGKDDLLGTDDSKTGGLFSAKRTSQNINRLFMLGQRDQVLEQIGKDPIITHVAQQANQSFPYYEFIFRSALHLLMDTACAEHAFLLEFFGRSHYRAEARQKAAEAGHMMDAKTPPEVSQAGARAIEDRTNQMFQAMMAKTISLYLEQLEDYLFGCYDPIGIVLMLRIVYLHDKLLQSRQVSCLNQFFLRMNSLLGPRFKALIDMNAESVAKMAPDPGKNLTQPHYLSIRFAALAHALTVLNKDYKDEIIVTSIARLRKEVESKLSAMAAKLTVPKLQLIFLINNYDTIRQTVVPDTDEEKRFRTLLDEQVAVCVESELMEKFGKLASFVRQADAQIAAAAKAGAAAGEGKEAHKFELNAAEAEGVARHFARSWKEGIENINASVAQSFPAKPGAPAAGGSASQLILQKALTQLVLLYNHFGELLQRHPDANVVRQLSKELVPIQTIMYEIKKNTSASQAAAAAARP